jgi:hypothetical protein
MLLLVRHLLQHGFRMLAPTALECAQLIVVDIVVGHLLACVGVCVMQLLQWFIYIYFFEK